MSSNGLLSVIKEATAINNTDIASFGVATVLSINPWRIKLDNGLEIPESLLLITDFCKDKKFNQASLLINHTHETIHGSSEIQTWEASDSYLWKGARAGEPVIYIKNSNRYLILQPVQGIHTDS